MSPDAAPPAAFGAKAAFAAAAFALALAAIFALERVGAPDRLVAALGPLSALIGIAGIGVLSRAKTLLDFLVARRAAPPLYAGLAIAAPIGGFALAFSGAAADPSRLPWRGVCRRNRHCGADRRAALARRSGERAWPTCWRPVFPPCSPASRSQC